MSIKQLSNTLYSDRDIIALDASGNYYTRHVNALTTEGLTSKSDIAAELGYRDMLINQLKAEIEQLTSTK
jgi:hypothetical protein